MALLTTSKPFNLSELKHTGKNLMVLCPFHDDHHPSLSVNLEKDVYQCFGCGAKGRASNLVEGFEPTTFTPVGDRAPKTDHISLQTWNAFEIYRQLGKEKEQEKILACGQEFITHHCPQCQTVTATPFHCNLPLCPSCYRRNMASFFTKHQHQLQDMKNPCVITISLGSFTWGILTGRAPEIWKRAITLHKAAASSLPRGGIYFKQITKENNLYWLTLNLLVDAPVTAVLVYSAFWITRGFNVSPKGFTQPIHALRFFIKRKCIYPTSMLHNSKDAELYLAITYRKKLIQGFGSFYRVSGGKNKAKKPRQVHLCPLCGASTITGPRVNRDQVFWHPDHKCFLVKQKLKEKDAGAHSPTRIAQAGTATLFS